MPSSSYPYTQECICSWMPPPASPQHRVVLILAARVIELWLVGASAVGLCKSWDFAPGTVLNLQCGQRAS